MPTSITLEQLTNAFKSNNVEDAEKAARWIFFCVGMDTTFKSEAADLLSWLNKTGD
jgi:hypothetical protein